MTLLCATSLPPPMRAPPLMTSSRIGRALRQLAAGERALQARDVEHAEIARVGRVAAHAAGKHARSCSARAPRTRRHSACGFPATRRAAFAPSGVVSARQTISIAMPMRSARRASHDVRARARAQAASRTRAATSSTSMKCHPAHQSRRDRSNARKAGRHFADAARKRDRLEALAHFARQRESLGFVDDAHALRLRRATRASSISAGNPLDEQELPLRRVADELEAGARAGFGDRREIDERGDVLQARPMQRIGVRAMAVVADERAVAALRQVELAARITVVDEERDAALERADHGRHPVRQLRQDFRAIAIGERRVEIALDVTHGRADERVGRTILARECRSRERPRIPRTLRRRAA